jgi:hypothetical protein
MDKQEKRRAVAQYKERLQQGGVYAIRCKESGKILLLGTTDIPGSRNRFEFAQSTGGCVHPKLRADWEQYGGRTFEFEIVETLTQKEAQTDADFQSEVAALLDLLTAQTEGGKLY